MKYIFSILFFSLSLLTLAQETYEICAGESKTITYYSETSSEGSNIWVVNGTQYIGETLTYTFDNGGVYNITVIRENGPCSVEENLQVVISECPGIIYWVPNSFTPDGDEHNQMFGPVMTEGFDVDGFTFLIFNRWGEMVWESHDPSIKWDGMYNGLLCQDGIYTWKLQFGILGDDGRITDVGHLSIIK